MGLPIWGSLNLISFKEMSDYLVKGIPFFFQVARRHLCVFVCV